MKILGTGSSLPQKIVSNDDLAQVMDTSDEWISSRTGIRNRHIAVEETTTSMSVDAAKKALADAAVAAEEIDLIIAATVSSDYIFPMLQRLTLARAAPDFCLHLRPRMHILQPDDAGKL